MVFGGGGRINEEGNGGVKDAEGTRKIEMGRLKRAKGKDQKIMSGGGWETGRIAGPDALPT
jgi:hypothetical protein